MALAKIMVQLIPTICEWSDALELGGWEMPKEASQTCHKYPTYVLKHLRSIECPSLYSTIPFAMMRSAHLEQGFGRKMIQLIIDSDHR